MSVPISRAERERVLAVWEKNRARAWQFDAESWRQWMSGTARSAVVRVEVKVKITDTATEGQMLDAVIKSLDGLDVKLYSDGGSFEVVGVECASVVTNSTGGHL